MKILIFKLVFFTCIWAIPLSHRLSVPLYFTISTGVGYDNNVLKFSEKEIDDSSTKPWLLNENDLASSILKNSITLQYYPFFISNHETQIYFKFNNSQFLDAKDKSNNSFSIKLSQHIGKYQWLKLSYSYIPHIYLRTYQDRDLPVINAPSDNVDHTIGNSFLPASFGIESVSMYYSHPLPVIKGWGHLKLAKEKQYYNENFTEFDLDINHFTLGLSLRNIPQFKFNFSFTNSTAENISFQNGLIASQYKDRGFVQQKIYTSMSISDKITPFFNGVGTSLSIENRTFSSVLDTDPLHKDRTHVDSKISLWLKKDLTRSLSSKIYTRYRSRQTASTEEFVEGLKSFSKYEFMFTLSYKVALNLYK